MPPRKRAWAFGLAPVMCWAGAWLRLKNKGWALPDAWAWAGPRPRPRLALGLGAVTGHNGFQLGLAAQPTLAIWYITNQQ